MMLGLQAFSGGASEKAMVISLYFLRDDLQSVAFLPVYHFNMFGAGVSGLKLLASATFGRWVGGVP
jgi:hypothetical protein